MQTKPQNVRAAVPLKVLWKWTGISTVLHMLLIGALCGISYMNHQKAEAARQAKAAAEDAALKDVMRPGEWNEYVVEAHGTRVRHWINGTLMTDVVDGDATRFRRDGQLAFQLHQGPPMEARFRAIEVTPIRELDGRVIGSGGRGPVTERLQALYFDTVNGRNPARMSWLTTV